MELVSANSSGEPLLPDSHGNAIGPVTELPKPELNPMLNPTLGRNLGRWAHVYFTSPPEKREQAVLELLRELEAESDAAEAAAPSSGTSTGVVAETRITAETVACAECGHQNAKLQRFCGMCGSPFTLDDPESDERNARDLPSAAPPPSHWELGSAITRDPVFPTLSLFAQVGEETPGSRDSGIQWLRDRDSDEDGATSPVLKYALLVLVILLAGAFFYNRSRTSGAHGPGEQGASGVWTGGGSSPPVRPQTGPPPSTPESANPGKVDAESKITPPPNPVMPKETAPESGPSARSTVDTTTPTPITDAGAKRGQVKATPPPQEPAATPHEPAATTQEPTAVSGSYELTMAEEYLMGKRGPRNTAVAATFLWKAVSKENTTATLLLSDLYRTGDGVPKSCDQARLLLYAAARKNVPEAGKKLRDLQGCR